MILRRALLTDLSTIWEIIQYAIYLRKIDGSTQWQNGYPNPTVLTNDIESGYAYVLEEDNKILAYAAIIFDVEPAYNTIEGKWLSEGPYVVIHRVASSKEAKGRGVGLFLFKEIEKMALQKNVHSIKVDTNHDNVPMLKILDQLAYSYCGQVYMSGAPRRAFEKLI